VARGSRKNREREQVQPKAGRAEPSLIPRPAPTIIKLKTIALLAIVAGMVVALVLEALSWLPQASPSTLKYTGLTFVGSETCSGCHQRQFKLWQSSQHRHAMDHATDASVRGDFNNVTFEYAGIRSRFFRRDQNFFVETDGPDGKLSTFEVKYTFGIDPLQQYLIEFPDGRIQALPIAWDTRPKDQGGQRWFHLYPNAAITHDDPLHWTKLYQNWNHMCAECHSTGVHKNYDAAHDRFATSFAEISVGCEACHGAGSRHVEWARGSRNPDDPYEGLLVKFDERAGVTWRQAASTHLPERSTPPALLRKEVETCGVCHSRRGQFSKDWKPGQWLSDTHRVSLLDRQRFEPDGQMRDDEETYNYLPFKQSKMFAKGVTCSDCHDPHSAALRAQGDGVCAQCHAAETYETATHRHHNELTPPLSCVSCHMPVRSYMLVDKRHDHSFRIPRPDLSMQLGTPNACNDCHRDKSAQWASKQITAWFGPQRHGYQAAYAAAFHAAWTEQVDAQALLKAVALSPEAPAPTRASALAELPVPDVDLARRALADADPMVRMGALDMLEASPAEQLWPLAASRLSDPVRGVRIRAVELLASVPPEHRPAADAERFARAASELIAAEQLNADRPDARTTLGNFYTRQGDAATAEAEYRAAIRLDPSFSAAAVNLSDLYRHLGRDADGVRVLHEALARSGQNASFHHALGLALVRQGKSDAALVELRRAAELDPGNARYAYVYAIGLNSTGHLDDALAVLRESLRQHPNDRDTISGVIAFARQKGDFALALEYAERLAQIVPNSALSNLIDQLRRQPSAAPGNPAQ
jgi:predicted CXXCH cytochrome family protein